MPERKHRFPGIPPSYEYKGRVGMRYNLYEADPDWISVIADGGIEVPMDGRPHIIGEGEYGYTFGANPCAVVLTVSPDVESNVRIIHFGNSVETDLSKLKYDSIGGIAGGNREILEEYLTILRKGHIRLLYPPRPGADFNVAAVRRDDLRYEGQRIPRGIYYGYGKEKLIRSRNWGMRSYASN